jgi:glyoxylase-like metal-dependent hydrolase (beta-lactamase superfamily II)
MKVHPILGAGNDSNVYLLLLDESAYLVDTGTGMHTDKVIMEVHANLGPRKLYSIILTHIHFDHSGGAGELSRLFNAPVMIHDSEAHALEKGDDQIACSWMLGAKLAPVKPKRLSGGELLPGGIEVMHTPGHSQGSVSLYHRESKSLFPGDTFFLYGGVGRWDLPSGDLGLLIASLKSLSKVDFERVYPGHGGFVESGGKEQLEMAMGSLGSMRVGE